MVSNLSIETSVLSIGLILIILGINPVSVVRAEVRKLRPCRRLEAIVIAEASIIHWGPVLENMSDGLNTVF
jgi:hypothetical protein